MKTVFLSFYMLMALNTAAQSKQYYNSNWEPSSTEDARFVSLVDKTDSGWVRRDFYLSTKKSQMKGLYKDSALKIKNGWFRYFYANQVLSSQGNFVNGKKDGLWLSYYYSGIMKDSIYYKMGLPKSTRGWHSNGNPSDSSAINEDGTGTYMAWFDNGQPFSLGRAYKGKKEGKWQYYHKNGNLAAVEEYEMDNVSYRAYYDENGVQLADTTNKARPAAFKGGEKKWKSFLTANLEFPTGVTLKNTEKITVVIDATIDEEGNISDAFVSVPVHPKFDEEALRVLNKSPKWIPAIAYNRYVKFYIRQSITFGQYDF